MYYPAQVGQLAGIKGGVLRELGFDDTTPNRAVLVPSWAYDAAVNAGIQIHDNRAMDVPCYLPANSQPELDKILFRIGDYIHKM